jgi:hypothetical protein
MSDEQYADYTFETAKGLLILRRYRDGSLYIGSTEDDLEAVEKPALRWWLRECLQALAEAEAGSEQ